MICLHWPFHLIIPGNILVWMNLSAQRLTATEQVEHWHIVLSRLVALPSLPLRIGPSTFHDVVHSICTEPLPKNCIASVHSQGARVIELLGCMVSGLDCLLRNGINIIQYSYCDISNHICCTSQVDPVDCLVS
jgi:hypothetical protein